MNGAVSLRMLNGNRKRVEKAPTPPMNASGEAFNYALSGSDIKLPRIGASV